MDSTRSDRPGSRSGLEVPPRHLPPRLSAEELARRNQREIELLSSWANEGDEAEQRETMRVLRHALGEGRIISSRRQFP